jgi:hypothetical protein
MTDTDAVVAMFDNHSAAEGAVKELQKSGFDMKKLSVVGRDYYTDEHVVGYYNAGDRMKYWGRQGAFWGGVCLAPHSSGCQQSARYLLPAHWRSGLWPAWRTP